MLLFNICSEKMFKEILGDINECILINGTQVNNLRYTDDTRLLVDSREVAWLIPSPNNA